MISIITPVYNSEKFIGDTVKSVQNQTVSDWQLILVDDCSTDNSLAVIKKLTAEDSRITVLSSGKNSGPAHARNIGIDYAISHRAEYLAFIDSDDKLDEGFLACACDLIEKYNQPDLLVFGFNVVDGKIEETVTTKDKYIADREDLAECYTEDLFKVRHGSGFLWNKIYKMSIIEENNVRFGTFRVQEDELFNIDYMLHVRNAVLCNKAFYTYFLNTTGNSRSKYLPNMLEILTTVYDRFMDLKHQLNITDAEFDHHLCNRSFGGVMNWVRNQAFHRGNNMSAEEKKQQIKALISTKMWNASYTYKKKIGLTVEERLYSNAILREDLIQLNIIKTSYSIIRTIIRHFR